MKPEIFLDEVNEGPNLLRLKRLRVNALQHVQHVLGSQKRKMMPALQPDINPVWHGEVLPQRAQLRSCSKRRRHQMLDDLRIESISGNSHARVPHDVTRDSAVPRISGADMHQREVA